VGLFDTGGGMGGRPSFAEILATQERQEAATEALVRGGTPREQAETLAGMGGGRAAMEARARTAAERTMTARRKAREAAAAGPPQQYYGRPGGKWVAYNIMFDYAKGRTDAEIVKRYAGAGASQELGKVAMRMGRQVLDTIPGASEVMAALDIAGKIPLVGDLTGAIEDILENIFGEGVAAIGDIAGGAIDILEEVPVVGEAVGAAVSVLKEIPLLGSLF